MHFNAFSLGFICYLFLTTVGYAQSDTTAIIPRAAITDKDCLECHGIKGYSVPVGEHGETEKKQLDINETGFYDSVHGQLTCLECHTDIKQIPHKKTGLEAVDCVSCHLNLEEEKSAWYHFFWGKPNLIVKTQQYTHSVHAEQNNEKQNAGCADCHTAHYVYPADNPQATTYRLNSPEMCGHCHTKALEDYQTSIHGAALKTPWKGESATCSDCHSSHQIFEQPDVSAHRVVTEQCGYCHQREVDSYMATTHGQLAWLGHKDVARCADLAGDQGCFAQFDPR